MAGPTTLTDPVLRLAEYWLAAKLMHEHVHAMRDDYGGLDAICEEGDALEFQVYLSFWLSALYVTAEGFQELGLDDTVLAPLVAQHIGSLRLYRNATFHFQRRPDKHVQFHDGQAMRLNWAEDVHAAFGAYFEQHIEGITGGARPE